MEGRHADEGDDSRHRSGVAHLSRALPRSGQRPGDSRRRVGDVLTGWEIAWLEPFISLTDRLLRHERRGNLAGWAIFLACGGVEVRRCNPPCSNKPWHFVNCP